MPGRSARLAVRAAGVLVAIAAVALVLLPWIASRRVFDDLIADEITRLTGASVTLSEPPQFSLLPAFSVRLRNVRIEDASARLDTAILDADLDIHRALTGEVRFRLIHLDAPNLTIKGTGLSGRVPFSSGRIGRTVQAAASNAAEAVPGDTGIGTVVITGGQVLFQNGEREEPAITKISGELAWPAFERNLKASGTATWQSLPLDLSADIQRPLHFIAGKTGPTRFEIDVEDGRLTFDGEGAWQAGPVANGKIAIRSGAFGALLARLGFANRLTSGMGEMSFSATTTASGPRMKFEDANIIVDAQSGTGAFDIDFGAPRVTASGTMAFKDVDLTPFVPALAAPSVKVAANMPSASNSGFGPFDVDLRLSAERARLGPLPLRLVAASIRIQPELAAFDISDAETLDGAIQAGLHAAKGPEPATELQFSATDINLGALSEGLGQTGLRPEGAGSFSIVLKGPSTDWAGMLEHATGNLSLRFGPGSFRGIGHAELVRQLTEGGPLKRSPVAGAELKVDGLEIRAPVVNGLVLFETAEMTSEAGKLSVAGLMSLRDFGLALTGRLADAAEPEPARLFFVGGTLDAPVFSPVGTTSTKPRP